MPASRQRWRSPAIAFAVIATIGRCGPVGSAASISRQRARGAVAVEHRHLAIHQHQVVIAVAHAQQRRFAVGRGVAFQAEHAEQALRDEQVDRVVFDQQHARLPMLGGLVAVVRPCVLRSGLGARGAAARGPRAIPHRAPGAAAASRRCAVPAALLRRHTDRPGARRRTSRGGRRCDAARSPCCACRADRRAPRRRSTAGPASRRRAGGRALPASFPPS